MVNNKGPEKESGNGLVHAMQRSGPQAKFCPAHSLTQLPAQNELPPAGL